MAALLLGCVKFSDTYKSVDWPAIATVGGIPRARLHADADTSPPSGSPEVVRCPRQRRGQFAASRHGQKGLLSKTGASGYLLVLRWKRRAPRKPWPTPSLTVFNRPGAISIFCALLAFTVALTQLIENAAVAIILAPI